MELPREDGGVVVRQVVPQGLHQREWRAPILVLDLWVRTCVNECPDDGNVHVTTRQVERGVTLLVPEVHLRAVGQQQLHHFDDPGAARVVQGAPPVVVHAADEGLPAAHQHGDLGRRRRKGGRSAEAREGSGSVETPWLGRERERERDREREREENIATRGYSPPRRTPRSSRPSTTCPHSCAGGPPRCRPLPPTSLRTRPPT